MDLHANDFERTLHRVHAGDRQARAQLTKEMEPHMARILGRAQAQGKQASPLGKRLLQTAQRLDPSAPTAALAHRLTRLVLDRLQPGSTEGFSLAATQTAGA